MPEQTKILMIWGFTFNYLCCLSLNWVHTFLSERNKQNETLHTGTCVDFDLVNIACKKKTRKAFEGSTLYYLIDHLSVVGYETGKKAAHIWNWFEHLSQYKCCIVGNWTWRHFTSHSRGIYLSFSKRKWFNHVLCHTQDVLWDRDWGAWNKMSV